MFQGERMAEWLIDRFYTSRWNIVRCFTRVFWFAMLERESWSWNIAAPDFSRTPRHFFLICILFAWFINCVPQKNEESQHRNEEMFDDVGILDTLRITLGGFARNTWVADWSRQCVSRPLAVIFRWTQEGVLALQNAFCSGSFCRLVSTREVFHVVCCLFALFHCLCFVSLSRLLFCGIFTKSASLRDCFCSSGISSWALLLLSFRTRGWEECQQAAKLREHVKRVIFNISDQHEGHDNQPTTTVFRNATRPLSLEKNKFVQGESIAQSLTSEDIHGWILVSGCVSMLRVPLRVHCWVVCCREVLCCVVNCVSVVSCRIFLQYCLFSFSLCDVAICKSGHVVLVRNRKNHGASSMALSMTMIGCYCELLMVSSGVFNATCTFDKGFCQTHQW